MDKEVSIGKYVRKDLYEKVSGKEEIKRSAIY